MASQARFIGALTVSALAAVGSLSAVEAKGLRLRGSWSGASRSAAPAAQPARLGPVARLAGASVIAANPATTGAVEAADPAVPRPGPEALRPTAFKEAAPAAKPAEPWCRSGRVLGSGAGFCLIN